MADPVINPPVVIDNPPIASKINWTQMIAFVTGILATFGFVIPAEWQTFVLQGLALITPVLTFIFRTWFTGKEATKTELKAALATKS